MALDKGSFLKSLSLFANGINRTPVKLLGNGIQTIASASTVDLSTATSDNISISGTTTITSFGTVDAGNEFTVHFQGALTITYNATTMRLPGSADILTAAGDYGRFRSLGSGNFRCVLFTRANGLPLLQREVITFRLTADETTAATVSTGKSYARFPYALTLDGVSMMAVTAPTTTALIGDITIGGSSIFSTKPQIDAAAKVISTGTPPVFSTTAVAADAELRADITQIGSGTAGAGVRLYLRGYYRP